MADWRQIQARIRKAKNSSDPPAQLAELYERTRDAMVAFELAQWHEKAGDGAAAAQWYTSAAQRFRRAQWRTKAEEALTRLGAPVPAPSPEDAAGQSASAETADAGRREAGEGDADDVDESTIVEETTVSSIQFSRESAAEVGAESVQEHPTSSEISAFADGERESLGGPHAQPATGLEAQPALGKKRRRGRRGGRGRRAKGGRVGAEGASPTAASPAPSSSRASVPTTPHPVAPPTARPSREQSEVEFAARPSVDRSDQPAASASWQSRTRAGEPALASRISQLESQLRRLLACPQSSLDEADQAPAGPGVLVLSDSDQVTHYYVEACQTLRIGVGNLLRGGRGDAVRLKERMAENLGIAESRVPKYLKDHCAVRWLQLDEGARELAHFAISVLRPAVNE